MIIASNLQVSNTREKHTSTLLLFPKPEIKALEKKHVFYVLFLFILFSTADIKYFQKVAQHQGYSIRIHFDSPKHFVTGMPLEQPQASHLCNITKTPLNFPLLANAALSQEQSKKSHSQGFKWELRK